MDESEAVTDSFPELVEITDDDLRWGVHDVWTAALADCPHDSLAEVPWWPPLATDLDDTTVTSVQHIRDVTAYAIAIADVARETLDVGVDRDVVVAGALLHDISKLYEIDTGGGTTRRHELLPHPHWGVHLLAQADFSIHLQHIVLAHSTNSGVAPQTLEALIVTLADQLAVASLFWDATDSLGPLTSTHDP